MSASGAAYESRIHADNRAIQVADYGTLGTGDDSATINNAIAAASGRRLVFPPNATLNILQGTANNLSNATIDGNGTTLKMVGTGARTTALQIGGVCDNLTVYGLRIKGDAVIANAQGGIMASGANTLTDIRIINCVVENTTVGVSIAADTTGATAKGVLYQGNTIRNIVGTSEGYGYGLHISIGGTSPANVRMIGNQISSVQRHSIYQAQGRGITIMGNSISDHRDQNTGDASILPALMIARSGDVSSIGNIIERPAGGGMYLSAQGIGSYGGDYIAVGNIIRDSQNGAALAYIGQLDPSTDGTIYRVTFAHNNLNNATACGCLVVYNGTDIDISRNQFTVTDTTAAASLLALQGVQNTTNQYMDRVTVDGNRFTMAYASSAAIRLSPGQEASTTNYKFRHNERTGGGAMFALSAVATNPNISVQNQERTGMSMAAGSYTTALQVGGPAATAAPSAGAAAALPATPAGYVTVNVNGTDRKVAYY